MPLLMQRISKGERALEIKNLGFDSVVKTNFESVVEQIADLTQLKLIFFDQLLDPIGDLEKADLP
jgi:hypothetical protein